MGSRVISFVGRLSLSQEILYQTLLVVATISACPTLQAEAEDSEGSWRSHQLCCIRCSLYSGWGKYWDYQSMEFPSSSFRRLIDSLK